MQDAVTVQIVERTIPADEQTRSWRQSVVDRLTELGQVDSADEGSVDAPVTVWAALIGGVEIPLAAYGVEQGDDGSPLLSIAFRPDGLQIGDPPARGEQPELRSSVPMVTGWNSPSPDSLGGQVARNAHDHTLKRWTCGCDPVLVGIRDAAAKTGNIDLRVVQA